MMHVVVVEVRGRGADFKRGKFGGVCLVRRYNSGSINRLSTGAWPTALQVEVTRLARSLLSESWATL